MRTSNIVLTTTALLFPSLLRAAPVTTTTPQQCQAVGKVVTALHALLPQIQPTQICSAFLSISTTSTTTTTATVSSISSVGAVMTTKTVTASGTPVTVTATSWASVTQCVGGNAQSDGSLPAKRALALPPALASYADPLISTACGCLGVTTPVVTKTATATVRATSTVTTSKVGASTTLHPTITKTITLSTYTQVPCSTPATSSSLKVSTTLSTSSGMSTLTGSSSVASTASSSPLSQSSSVSASTPIAISATSVSSIVFVPTSTASTASSSVVTSSTAVPSTLVSSTVSSSAAVSSSAPPSAATSSISSLLVASSSTAVSSTASAAPTECGNYGLEYALYPNVDQDIFTEPSQYLEVNPISTGTTPYLGFHYPPGDDPTLPQEVYSTLLGSAGVHLNTFFAVDHRGYIYAPVTGTYTFLNIVSDDNVFFWIGEQALAGWNSGNANGHCQGCFSPPYGSFSVDLVAGVYTPFRVFYDNASGGGSLQVDIQGPDGSLVEVSPGDFGNRPFSPFVDGGFFQRFSCDGRTPPYGPWVGEGVSWTAK